MYKCLIIDDEELARNLIRNHLLQLSDFEIVAICKNAIEASKILKENEIDLMFLDIEMPILTGTDFYKSLLHKPKVIFTTAYREYALDGFELNAVDYLLKPITFQRFFRAIEKFLALHQKTDIQEVPVPLEKKSDHLFITLDRKQVKIEFEEILYVESLKDYIKIHTNDNCFMIKFSITAFEQKLDHRFLRTHRSYIVNKNKITAFTKHDIEIGNLEIPIGGRYKEEVLNKIQ